jgi:hypothetical protein
MQKTGPDQRVRIARDKYEANSRIFAIAFVRFFQQACRAQMKLFADDIDLVVVAGSVAIANIETRMRDKDFRREFRDVSTVVGIDRQRGCNALSVAEATGLPRETVRRKINRLVEMGILVRRGVGDYVLRPGVIQTPPFADMFRDMSDELLRMVNECLDEEVFSVSSTSA